MFLLIEIILGILVIGMASLMIREKNGEDLERISVIIQNSDDNQWTAFQYGLKMAAEDQGVELFVAGTGDRLTVEEQKNLIEQEIDKGCRWDSGAAGSRGKIKKNAEKSRKKSSGDAYRTGDFRRQGGIDPHYTA